MSAFYGKQVQFALAQPDLHFKQMRHGIAFDSETEFIPYFLTSISLIFVAKPMSVIQAF